MLARMAPAMDRHHGLAERDVMDGVSGGCRRLPAVRHAIVEMDELFLEALLIGRDLLCTRCARRHFPAVLGDEKRGHAAEERGGECEGDSPLRRVKRE